MSSATSTKGAPSRALPDGPPAWSDPHADDGLRPWQFFVLAALGCATAVTWLARGQGVTSVILLSVLMGAVALAGMAALRMLTPLVTPGDDRTAMVGERTRTALEREKLLTLRAIKELEFDRAMHKLSDDDFREMSGKLRARAARLMKQLDAGANYRERIEQDLAKRMGGATIEVAVPAVSASTVSASTLSATMGSGPASATLAASAPAVRPAAVAAVKGCESCATPNDLDARFCKACGAKL